jgi:7-cyano-7-deazaguanine reductase
MAYKMKKTKQKNPKTLSSKIIDQEKVRHQEVLALGSKVDYQTTYHPQVLESFENRHPGVDAWTSLVCTEFTSLCPKTGQPDFARIYINYVADQKMVESKSLKLYLFSFRNHGDFHEDCIQTICDDLVALLSPRYLEVIGEFTPRGGISIWPYVSYAQNTFLSLKQKRFEDFAPGKFSVSLSKIY